MGLCNYENYEAENFEIDTKKSNLHSSFMNLVDLIILAEMNEF